MNRRIANVAPKSNDYGESHVGKGQDYDDNFGLFPGRKLMWELEQDLLHRVIGFRRFQSHLDFACGTGRLLHHLSPFTSQKVGLDVSPSMVAVARKKCPEAKIIVADFREDSSLLSQDSFELVTAFRFFANAQPELRAQAMMYLAARLAESGLMLVNNHRNLDSLAFRSLATFRTHYRTSGMRHDEMLNLGRNAGLELVGVFGIGFLPQNERWSLLPWGVTGWLERRFSKAFANRHRLGCNVIYAFTKSQSRAEIPLVR